MTRGPAKKKQKRDYNPDKLFLGNNDYSCSSSMLSLVGLSPFKIPPNFGNKDPGTRKYFSACHAGE